MVKRDYIQKCSIDYKETFSPAVKYDIRLTFCIATVMI